MLWLCVVDVSHCRPELAVEVQRKTLPSQERRRGEDERSSEAADIKSNNPHLTGGESPYTILYNVNLKERREKPRATAQHRAVLSISC